MNPDSIGRTDSQHNMLPKFHISGGIQVSAEWECIRNGNGNMLQCPSTFSTSEWSVCTLTHTHDWGNHGGYCTILDVGGFWTLQTSYNNCRAVCIK